MLAAVLGKMKVEGRVESTVTAELVKHGHLLKVVEDYTDTMGHAKAILIDPVTNIKYGGADSRKDESAVRY
jgi:gamma-glutamyltranspeptidase/glutathione hydrolase